jgi:hypothetical protein
VVYGLIKMKNKKIAHCWNNQNPVDFCKKKKANSIPIIHIYMTAQFPDLGHTLQSNVAGLN